MGNERRRIDLLMTFFIIVTVPSCTGIFWSKRVLVHSSCSW